MAAILFREILIGGDHRYARGPAVGRKTPSFTEVDCRRTAISMASGRAAVSVRGAPTCGLSWASRLFLRVLSDGSVESKATPSLMIGSFMAVWTTSYMVPCKAGPRVILRADRRTELEDTNPSPVTGTSRLLVVPALLQALGPWNHRLHPPPR